MNTKVIDRKTFYSLLCVGYATIFGLILSLHLISNYSIKRKMAETIVAGARGHLLVRSLRRLQENLEYHTNVVNSFSLIQVRSAPILGDNILTFGDQNPGDFSNQCLHEQLFFDSNGKSELGGIKFCYGRFNSFSYEIIGYFAFVLFTFPFMQRYRKRIIQSIETEKEAAIGRIITQLSHDLRAPLNSIERLLHLPPDISVASQQGIIRESLRRLNSMIESLRHADLELMIEPQYSNPDFRSGLLGLEAKAEGRGIVLYPPESGLAGQIRVDPLKFERAWVNLVSNAIDAARSEVRIEVRASGSTLFLRVIDDGPGVPPEVLPKLFQRGMTHGKKGGTGLGLAYVRQIMQGHGGDVSYSRMDGRTIFECQLPHAFILKEEKIVANPSIASEEAAIVKFKRVAICLAPKTLAAAIQANLAARKTENFSFSCGSTDNADVVVSNDDEILFKAMDEGRETIQLKEGLTEAKILERLTRKFNLV